MEFTHLVTVLYNRLFSSDIISYTLKNDYSTLKYISAMSVSVNITCL